MDCEAVTGALPPSWVVECAVVISGMPAVMRLTARGLYDKDKARSYEGSSDRVGKWSVEAVCESERRKYARSNKRPTSEGPVKVR